MVIGGCVFGFHAIRVSEQILLYCYATLVGQLLIADLQVMLLFHWTCDVVSVLEGRESAIIGSSLSLVSFQAVPKSLYLSFHFKLYLD